MAASIEPIQSFAYLRENIPQWLTKIAELNAQCDEQYDRFYKLTKHGEVKLTRKTKHDSTESLRPTKDTTTVPFFQIESSKDLTPTAPATVTAALAEATQTAPPPSTPLTSHQPSLKRKPTSALSAASPRGGYRTKSMIVVYYDSAIQDSFESIVKNISNARSNLRKGRTTATFQARMASMAPASDPSTDPSSPPSTKFIMPSFGRIRENVTEKQKYKAYDEADRDLEEAQRLSEKAAHQFLRDGDCNLELASIRKRFHAVHALAEREYQTLKDKQESSSVEQIEVSVPYNPAAAAAAVAEKGIEQILHRTYPMLPPTSLLSSSPNPLEAATGTLPPPTTKQMHFAAMGAIEVDDAASDASSVKIDMDAVRRVTRRVL